MPAKLFSRMSNAVDYWLDEACHVISSYHTYSLCLQVWQYVTLMRRIFLIDCPGVVYPSGDTEADIVLKGIICLYAV